MRVTTDASHGQAWLTPGQPAWSGGSAEIDVVNARCGDTQRAAGGVGKAGEHLEGGQAATPFDADDRGLGGAHPPGQFCLGQARPGAQRIDQLGQLPGEGGGGVGPVVFLPVLWWVLRADVARLVRSRGGLRFPGLGELPGRSV